MTHLKSKPHPQGDIELNAGVEHFQELNLAIMLHANVTA